MHEAAAGVQRFANRDITCPIVNKYLTVRHRRPRVSVTKGIRHVVYCLMLFAFVCRAMIPVGFMPSANASGDMPGMILCSAGMATGVEGGEAPQNNKHDHDRGAHAVCPFSALNLQAALSFSGGVLEPPTSVAATIVVYTAHAQQSNQMSAGPPLGPRAPPILL